MSKSAKKNRWILKFVVFAIVCVIAAVFGSKINKNIPNIIAVIYLIAGVVWFYINTSVKIKVPKNMKMSR